MLIYLKKWPQIGGVNWALAKFPLYAAGLGGLWRACKHRGAWLTSPLALGPIPAATQNGSSVLWHKGRDCGPRSGPETSQESASGYKRRPRPAVGLSERSERVETAPKSVGLSERNERVETAPKSVGLSERSERVETAPKSVGLSERSERVETAPKSVGLSERSERGETATQRSETRSVSVVRHKRAKKVSTFLAAGLSLVACDQAIDDRYAGLVVVPVQEVPVTRTPGVGGIAGAADLPRRRPARIPEREPTPREAQLAALDAAATLDRSRENAATAQAEADLAEQRRRDREQELIAAQAAEQLAADLRAQQSAIGTLNVTDPTLGSGALDLDDDGFARDATAPVLTSALIPRPRPTNLPQSFAEAEAFYAEQARLEAERARAEEAARQLAAAQEAARQAEAERLAAARLQAERDAAAAAAAAAEAARVADEEVARQRAAEIAAAQAEQEAQRLAAIGSTIATPAPGAGVPNAAEGSVSVPLIYSASAPLASLGALQAVFDESGFDLTAIMAGNAVPAIILQRLPSNLGELGLSNPNLQHDLFLKAVLPLCLVANERIDVERTFLRSDGEVEDDLGQVQNAAVRGLGFKYDTASRTELRGRIDAVPVSLCLAQALIASSSGQSPEAIEHNALFGPWTRDPDPRRLARPLTPGETLPQTTFPSLQAAVDAFALYLNRGSQFAEFRAERARATQQGRRLSGMVAAEFMAGLNPEDAGTISNLIQVIRENRLDQYDLSRLEGPRRAVTTF